MGTANLEIAAFGIVATAFSVTFKSTQDATGTALTPILPVSETQALDVFKAAFRTSSFSISNKFSKKRRTEGATMSKRSSRVRADNKYRYRTLENAVAYRIVVAFNALH